MNCREQRKEEEKRSEERRIQVVCRLALLLEDMNSCSSNRSSP
jgi:hypothetical protein